MSGRGRRGRPRRVIPAVSDRPAVPERDEHVVGSTTASMNHPPTVGQAGPSGPPEGAQVPGNGNPEAAWLWLDRVNKVYRVMGCTDEQRVLFSSFLMEDRAKDWWDAVERRYPDGISWDQFQQEFTDIFFPQSHKDSKIEEFFKLEQKNMSISEYEKKFSELVRLVPYIQEDEVLKCKRFLSGL